jgi:hypothetical protein
MGGTVSKLTPSYLRPLHARRPSAPFFARFSPWGGFNTTAAASVRRPVGESLVR